MDNRIKENMERVFIASSFDTIVQYIGDLSFEGCLISEDKIKAMLNLSYQNDRSSIISLVNEKYDMFILDSIYESINIKLQERDPKEWPTEIEAARLKIDKKFFKHNDILLISESTGGWERKWHLVKIKNNCKIDILDLTCKLINRKYINLYDRLNK